MANGFYVPGSISQSYVKSQRDETGALKYQSAENELNIQKQAALQDLGKEYESTIENAYASYLANQRAIDMSAMGQGYKEAYLQKQQEQLQQNIASTNISAAKARSEIEAGTAQSQTALQQMFETETANLDRVAASMNDYLTYVKSLSTEEGIPFLTEVESQKPIDEMYDMLMGLDTGSLAKYTGEDTAPGKSYAEWIKGKLGTSSTKADTDWTNWLLYEGGYQAFKDMISKSDDQYKRAFEADATKIPSYVGKAKYSKGTGNLLEDTIEYNNKQYEPYTYTTKSGEVKLDYTNRGTLDMRLGPNQKYFGFKLSNKIAKGELAIGDLIAKNNELFLVKDINTLIRLREVK